MKDGGTVTGFTNPAKAALAAAEGLFPNDEIDGCSFEEVARIIGDSPESVTRDGFFVYGIEGFEKLCQIGGFSVEYADGRLRCVLPALKRSAS